MKQYVSFAAFAALLVIYLGSCHRQEANELAHNHNEEAEVAAHESGHAKGEIIIEPETARQFGITVQTVTEKPFQSSLTLTGQLLPSPAGESVISAPTSGILKLNTSCIDGAHISAGQSIGVIKATNELGDNPNNVASADIAAAKREIDRLRPLLDDGIATNAEYQAAVNAYERAKASYSHAAASGSVKAFKNGTITQVLASTGQHVATGEAIARMSDNSILLLKVDLPERYASVLNDVRNVEIKDVASGEWVDLTNRGLRRIDRNDAAVTNGYKPIYFTFNNGNTFSAGSFVDVTLKGSDSQECVAVPASALIEQQGAKYIYVKIGDHAYLKRKVTVGSEAGNEIEILSGVKAGENVVISGVNSVKMAESSGAVPEGHSHNH